MRAKYLETLYHYDRPLLYSAEVDDGGFALVMLVEDVEHPTEPNKRGESEQIGHCMVVRCGKRRFESVMGNCITLREAFHFPEDGQHFELVELNGWWEFNECTRIEPGTLNLDWLSTGGARMRMGKRRRPRRVLTPRERHRQQIRRHRAIEHRPQRSWNRTLWDANARYRAHRAEESAKQAALVAESRAARRAAIFCAPAA